MPFKINISNKEGKTFKLEAEALGLINKSLGETIQGVDVSPDLAGYEFEITGTSDKSGITSMKEVEGSGLKKVLLTYGKGMHKRPKGLTKLKNRRPGGLRLRKSARGKVISEAISQINLKITKEGGKKLSELFPEQNKAPEAPAQEASEQAQEEKKEIKQEAELAQPEKEPTSQVPEKKEE